MAGWGMDSFLEGFLSEASFTFDPDVSAPPPQEPAVMADFPNLAFDAIPAPAPPRRGCLGQRVTRS
jgi:hypothetical protein